VEHLILIGDDPGQLRPVYIFKGEITSRTWIDVEFPYEAAASESEGGEAAPAVSPEGRFLEVRTLQSGSWVAWYKIRVIVDDEEAAVMMQMRRHWPR
jgi:hypothetical protein